MERENIMYEAVLEDVIYEWDDVSEVLTATKNFYDLRLPEPLRDMRVKVNFNKPASLIEHNSTIFREKILNPFEPDFESQDKNDFQ
jgi:hypothetical protein